MHELDDKRIKRLGWGIMILFGILLFLNDPRLVISIAMIYVGYSFVYYGYNVEHFKKRKEEGQFSSEEEMQKEEQRIKEKFAFSSMYLSPSAITGSWYFLIITCAFISVFTIFFIVRFGIMNIERFMNLF